MVGEVQYLVYTLDAMTDILLLDREPETEDQKVRNWLSTFNFWATQNDTFKERQSETGEWLLIDEKFQSWIRGETKYLWCPGGRNSPLRMILLTLH